MKYKSALVWFRNDLRLHDHEPLTRALQQADSVTLVYCFDPRHFGQTPVGFPKTGAFRAQFLLESIAALRMHCQSLGGELVIRQGKPEEELPVLAETVSATAVFFHQEVASEEISVEGALEKALSRRQIAFKRYWGATLYHIEDLPFPIPSVPDIYTQFRKAVERESSVRGAFGTPTSLIPLAEGVEPGDIPTLTDFDLTPPEHDDRGVLKFRGGEQAGQQRLRDYFWEQDCLRVYKQTRNGLVGANYSSKFSAWLALGCLSPRYVYEEVERYERERISNQSTYWLVFELIWRDYFRFAAKKYGDAMFRMAGTKGEAPDLRDDERLFDRWVTGSTGVPFIDANMREIAATGFMSNRGRQNVASFLTKDLRINWTWGAEYFESQLIDYDVCSNWLNWNYVAGVGNDPREGRYFNVSKQAQQYDPKGEYVKRWVPELSGLPAAQVHQPYALNPSQLSVFDVSLGADYPHPIVHLKPWKPRR